MKTIQILFLLGVIFSLNGCGDFIGGESANTPQEMFEYVVEKPIPIYVKSLEGGGYTWQGYSIYLRFSGSDEFVKALINKGYKEVRWEDISSRFELPKEFKKKFSSPWCPEKIRNKRCFEKDVKNSWTHSGTHRFVFDADTKEIYFYGIGA